MDRAEAKSILLTLLGTLDRDAIKMAQGPTPPVNRGTEVVMALSVSCLRLTRAVQLLIHRELPEEALILCRTLIQDSTLLAYLHRHQDRLQALAYSIIWQALKEDAALEKVADSLGMKSPAVRGPRIAGDMAALQKEMKARNLTRPPTIPSIKNMLSELDARPMYWSYKKASQMVHSTTGLATRLDWDEQRGLINPNLGRDSETLYLSGWMAAEGFMTGTIATGLIFDWDVTWATSVRPQIRAIYVELVRRERYAPGKDEME